MTPWLAQPAFVAYAVACAVLAGNLMFLWFASAKMRAASKTAMNPEDAALFKSTLVESDPPDVARVLRAHDNAQASTYPFLFLGLVFVMAGGGATVATVLFAVFTVARLAHTVAYLKALQPWRTVAFLAGAVVIVALIVAILWLVFRAAG